MKSLCVLVLTILCLASVTSSAIAQKGTVGMVKEQTRLHPGWESPTHPHVKGFLPGKDPISNLPLVRKGEWTCPTHPEVSATAPGKCPLGGEDLVKVEGLEKKTGKKIEDLTKESLAKQKQE